jgi:esterase/lipase superfamily enzyme
MCAVLTAVLMLARFRRGRVVMRSLAWLSLAATLVLGGLTIAYQWLPESADPPIERMYGNDRGELEMGTCEVSIPKEHEVGQLESPTVLRLEFRQDPERHVVLLGVQPEAPSKFFGDLRACIDRTARQEAFVFVHGYNVGFEAAVRRTAQIAYDLKFEGAPIVYSWPSQEGLLSYTVDETNVAWTVPHLKEFLLGVAEKSGAKSVHLVAHSMGNRALTSALRELTMERKTECPRFHEVVLTAPDIDADVFRRDLAPAIVGTADRVTLYASSNDEALIASRTVHGYRRAGESGKMVVVVPGIDTVDVSEIDTSLIGHSYYGSNSTVLADLFELLQGSKSPDQRTWLRSMRLGALKYWKFLRDPGRASPSEGEPL